MPDGISPLSPTVAAQLMRRGPRRVPAPTAELTRRELEILGHIMDGKTNQDIADALYISEKTVKSHCSSLFQRIGVELKHFDQIYTLGGRSITIFRQEADGSITKVRETGADLRPAVGYADGIGPLRWPISSRRMAPSQPASRDPARKARIASRTAYGVSCVFSGRRLRSARPSIPLSSYRCTHL